MTTGIIAHDVKGAVALVRLLAVGVNQKRQHLSEKSIDQLEEITENKDNYHFMTNLSFVHFCYLV